MNYKSLSLVCMGDKVTSLLKGIPKGGRKLSYTVFDSQLSVSVNSYVQPERD